MIDKQIIIDGVDVRECEWFQKWNSRCSLYDGPCGGHPECDNEMLFNCSHKQLQRKKQECDMWKNLTVDNGAVALKYQKQLKQVEQKLEKIKEICKNVMPTGIDEETDKFGDILEIIEE